MFWLLSFQQKKKLVSITLLFVRPDFIKIFLEKMKIFLSRSLFITITYKYYILWQYGLWSFQTGDTKLERFLPKNHFT